MLGRTYDREVCSAARALEVVGERWSLLILRTAAFAGVTRFTDFQARLGIAPNVLTARLELFVSEGLMVTEPTSTGHDEYKLTDKGRDIVPVIVALTAWGDRWQAPEGAPIEYVHDSCGGLIRPTLMCDECGSEVAPEKVIARPTEIMERALKRRAQTATRRR